MLLVEFFRDGGGVVTLLLVSKYKHIIIKGKTISFFNLNKTNFYLF